MCLKRGHLSSGPVSPFPNFPEIPPAFPRAEAPAGFGNDTNGFVSQGQFDLDLATFEEREGIADGLGPVYNAQACAECHQNSVTGGNSQVTVLRVGRWDGKVYQDRPGGSLIQDRAIDPTIQERVSNLDNVRTFRTSLSVLGDGIVQNGGPQTRTLLRTPPLWGLRTRSRLMHDGATLTRHDAILRHDREARPVVQSYLRLSPQQKDQLIAFLSSL